MPTVLVCVRTLLAAQTIASCAARLGVAGSVRTAVSEAEAVARLTERPADVVLADTALTRPDSVGFTRRVLARSPEAVIVLFGAEDPRNAAAAVAAGARGLIRGADRDLVSCVAKALLLLNITGRVSAAPGAPSGGIAARGARAGRGPASTAPAGGGPASTAPAPGGAPPGGGGATTGAVGLAAGTTVVPAQRADQTGPSDASADANIGPSVEPPAPAAQVRRRTVLTERELQVLHRMADGKSNAEIGRELYVSEDTVKTHARRLFRKLGARDRAHAVAAGFRAGLVE
ncbi:MAG TPA: LuxR C-terminal-related transcriptional regulator [Micromonosporaceae bacterium]